MLQVGVDAPQPSKSSPLSPIPAEIGDDNLSIVSDNGKNNLTVAVDNDPYLSLYFPRALGEITGKFGRNDKMGGNFPSVNPFQIFYLACSKPVGITV
jgi:hypothetical protein